MHVNAIEINSNNSIRHFFSLFLVPLLLSSIYTFFVCKNKETHILKKKKKKKRTTKRFSFRLNSMGAQHTNRARKRNRSFKRIILLLWCIASRPNTLVLTVHLGPALCSPLCCNARYTYVYLPQETQSIYYPMDYRFCIQHIHRYREVISCCLVTWAHNTRIDSKVPNCYAIGYPIYLILE